ncbi:MAG: RNA methyltransferase [Cytophagaceae bacterium]|nr:RNA methyltransferase [Cytophagaceae bacterium]
MTRKKQRDTHGLFLAEGVKLIADLYDSGLQLHLLVATEQWFAENKKYNRLGNPEIVTDNEFRKLSQLKTPQNVLALFRMPNRQLNEKAGNESLVLGLDGIQDPGNMGTIVRIADWFGIRDVVCSIDTVDVFNPKVVQATMGAIARVGVYYVDFAQFCNSAKKSGANLYGTFLNGENIYTANLSANGIIIVGNEGNGIRPKIESLITKRITIPSFSDETNRLESLNAATATAIVCSEFRRSTFRV